MNQMIGTSNTGDVKEAARAITGLPALILLFSNSDRFEDHCKAVSEIFSGVPCLGAKAGFYDTAYHDKVSIVAFYGVSVVTGVLRNVSKCPVMDIGKFEQNVKKINPGRDDTVIIDFCTGNDAAVLTTINLIMQKYNLQLTGGTGDDSTVMCDGTIYHDACVYALVRNTGKVRVYKENIYKPRNMTRYIASKTNTENYYIGELNGRPAKQVYAEANHLRDDEVAEHTKVAPFGRIVGNDIFIVSLSGTSGTGLTCFRQVNDSDVLYLMDIIDIADTANKTVSRIKQDFKRISGSFSVNCVFRYDIISKLSNFDEYLRIMSQIKGFCGFIGYGEHYNTHFVNQSMSCVVFE